LAAFKHVVSDIFFQQDSALANRERTTVQCCSGKLSISFILSYGFQQSRAESTDYKI